MGVVTGSDANIVIASGATAKAQSVWGISDFSLTFDRGTVEQALVGETGNWFGVGSLSIEGSYTCCKFGASGNCDSLVGIVEGQYIVVSGTTAANDISWRFVSSQISGYDISIGDADTISEASIDFVVMNPYMVTINPTTGFITDIEGG